MASDEPGLARIRRIRPHPGLASDRTIVSQIRIVICPRGRLDIGEGIGQNLNPGRRSPHPSSPGVIPLLGTGSRAWIGCGGSPL
jgi:hypothetical protein